MADRAFDFAICGSSPFARLLAGVLATAHGKRVCLVGAAWSPYRLPRGFDLSVMSATRPETWLMLKRGDAETLKLLASIGKGLYERIDPLFVGEAGTSMERLGHMRWVALGLGFAAERAIDRSVTEAGAICRIRGAAMLVAERAEPAIDAWLAKAGVSRRTGAMTSIAQQRDGTFILGGGDDAAAQSVILADDEALLDRIPAGERHRLLTVAPQTSLVTEPARPLPAPIIAYLDREVVLHQRQGKGQASIAVLAGGEADAAAPRIGSALAAHGRLRRAGQARFLAVGTLDGAPLIGRLGKGRLIGIAALGPSAAFLAPMLARHFAGAASEDESQYFAARDVARAAHRAAVAEHAAASVPDLETVS